MASGHAVFFKHTNYRIKEVFYSGWRFPRLASVPFPLCKTSRVELGTFFNLLNIKVLQFDKFNLNLIWILICIVFIPLSYSILNNMARSPLFFFFYNLKHIMEVVRVRNANLWWFTSWTCSVAQCRSPCIGRKSSVFTFLATSRLIKMLSTFQSKFKNACWHF